MMVRLIYRPASEQARPAEEFWHEYQRRTGRALTTIDPDTPEGSALCQVYDIVRYPAVLATRDDGTMQFIAQGLPMPLSNEVEYYDQV